MELADMDGEAQLLFTEEEWAAATPNLVRDMTAFLRPYRAPIFENFGDHGQGWGSGSFLSLEDRACVHYSQRATPPWWLQVPRRLWLKL
jgi:hypothetical protein